MEVTIRNGVFAFVELHCWFFVILNNYNTYLEILNKSSQIIICNVILILSSMDNGFTKYIAKCILKFYGFFDEISLSNSVIAVFQSINLLYKSPVCL